MNGAVILAGGRGTRFKGQKQFALLCGKEMWRLVYDKTAEAVDKRNIIVVGVAVEGGDTRSASVVNGLMELSKDTERVAIVEAARPLVTPQQIRELLDHKAESVTYALPLVNTVIGRDGTYYDRNGFYDLLTPQAFCYEKLKCAYLTGKYGDMTDETIVMYREYGIKPSFILGGENLVKVTYERDMEVIRAMMERPVD